jgi:hypothetical protein
MAGWSDSAELALLNLMFGGVSTAPPIVPAGSSQFIALFTTAPGDDGTGGVEVATTVGTTLTGYGRLPVPNNATTWKPATLVNVAPGNNLGTKTNATAFVFPSATAAGWGVIVAAGVFTASTGGTMIASGPLTTAMTIGAGAIANIPVDGFVITLD